MRTRSKSTKISSLDDISDYLLSIRKKHFMAKDDSLLPLAFEILGYQHLSESFAGPVSMTNFVRTITQLFHNKRASTSPFSSEICTPPRHQNGNGKQSSG